MKILLIIILTQCVYSQKTGDIKTIKINKNISIEMIYVSPGKFMMGSKESDPDRNPARETYHSVTLTKGYWLAKTETMQKIWVSIMNHNPSKIKFDYHPVENISYNDVLRFINRINKQGHNFRLPTEAEWEFACRAGTTDPYAGNRDEMTWHQNNSNKSTHPVATKKPNAWGFYDMHGNVGEYVSDWLSENLSESIDPIGPQSGEYKVLRGGQYTGRIKHTRSSDRQRMKVDEVAFYAGFRLAHD